MRRHVATRDSVSRPTPTLRTGLHTLLGAFLCLLLAGCGFHLKGATPVPFETIYTNINLDTEFGVRLRRTIQANSPHTRFVDNRRQADVYLQQISNDQRLRQLSIDADGRVEEYELALSFIFQVLDREGHIILAPTTLRSIRDIPYNVNVVQAKENEITRMFNDMQISLIDQILRRLSAPEVRAAYQNAAQQPSAPIPEDTPVNRSTQPGWIHQLPNGGRM
ncbi:hypothetical protein KVP09_00800 [Alcaligenaceae bacterium CGII-47]|nr:hypothetical protein [Alcaligenaceae bacterium CGII-47]